MKNFKHVWMEGFVGNDYYIASGNVSLPDRSFEKLIVGFRYLFAHVLGMPANKVKLKRVEISEAREGEKPFPIPMDIATNIFVYMPRDDEDGDFIDMLPDEDEDSEDE